VHDAQQMLIILFLSSEAIPQYCTHNHSQLPYVYRAADAQKRKENKENFSRLGTIAKQRKTTMNVKNTIHRPLSHPHVPHAWISTLRHSIMQPQHQPV